MRDVGEAGLVELRLWGAATPTTLITTLSALATLPPPQKKTPWTWLPGAALSPSVVVFLVVHRLLLRCSALID